MLPVNQKFSPTKPRQENTKFYHDLRVPFVWFCGRTVFLLGSNTRIGHRSLHQQTQRIYACGHFSRSHGFETFGQHRARRNCAGGDEFLIFDGLFVTPEAFGVTKLPSL